MKGFKSADEFKVVFEQIFRLMNEHGKVGRALRDAHAPHKFEITDMGLEFNVTAADDAEEKHGRFLRWVWGPPDWEPVIVMKMSAETANRFFQGKESIALAIAMGRAKIKGPMSTILKLAPVTNPIHPVYRKWLQENGYEHLIA
jgi:hypothetical protein